MALCPNCGQLSDMKLQMEELKLALRTVRAKLDDSQRLNFVLEKYALTVDKKVTALETRNVQIDDELKRLKAIGIVQVIQYNYGPSHQPQPSANEAASDASCTNDFVGGEISDQDDTEVDEAVPDHEMSSSGEDSYSLEPWTPNLRKRSFKKNKRSKTNRTNFTCGLCSFTTPYLKRFEDHIKSLHVGYKPFECDVNGCIKKYTTKRTLRLHQEEPHNIPPVDELPTRPSQPPLDIPIYKCDLCDFSSCSLGSYTNHIHTEHPGHRPFKCDFEGCKKSYSILQLLRTHKRNHTGERPYVCKHTNCSMAFENYKKMSTHIRNAHKEVFELNRPSARVLIPFEGPSTSRDGHLDSDNDECPSAFVKRVKRSESQMVKSYSLQNPGERLKYAVLSAREAVLGLGVGKYQCDHCDHSTNYIRNFESHAKEHPGYENLFNCEFEGCDKSFSKGASLRIHNKVHRGEFNFICNVEGCGRAYVASDSLNNHTYRKHRELSKHKPHVCPVEDCRKEFYAKTQLTRHTRKTHTT